MKNGTLRQSDKEALLAALRELFPARLHGELFLVGGTVRDFLLGRSGGDIDLAAAVPPEELKFLGFRPVTPKSAAPIWFLYHPGLGKVEVTPLDAATLLEDDLSRRDFTINAMAMTLEGALLDPLDGGEALKAGLLRPCNPRVFLDDPARIFRALRFEAEGWRLAPEAERLIREGDWTLALEKIPAERFSAEMLKSLAGAYPGRFFSRMSELGVGGRFLPELFRMPHVPAGPLVYHPEGDLLTHSLEVLERMASFSPDVTARFCAFFHDIGKLATAPELYPRHFGHDREGSTMAEALCTRLRLPAAMRRALSWSCRLHLTAARWPELRDSTKIRVAEEARKAGIAAILPLVVRADRKREDVMAGWEIALRIIALSTAELGIEPQLLADGGVQSGIRPIPPAERPSFIRARRVAEFRRLLRE